LYRAEQEYRSIPPNLTSSGGGNVKISRDSTLTESDYEAIRSIVEDQWTAAGLAQEWDKALALCTDDIVYLPPGIPALVGKQALGEWLDQFPPISRFEQTIVEVGGTNTLAVTHIAFSATVGGADTQGNILCTFQQGDTRQWRIKSVSWNWDNPA
jgi:ketosteroid isomerase-like protein